MQRRDEFGEHIKLLMKLEEAKKGGPVNLNGELCILHFDENTGSQFLAPINPKKKAA